MTETDTITIRAEEDEDHARVLEILGAAFETNDEVELVDALRHVDARISLVAELDGRVVGHVLLTPVTVGAPGSGSERRAMGLGPLAVDADAQRGGIGSQLMRAGLGACRELGEHVVFVLGHPDYYPRFGFGLASEHGLYFRDETFGPHFFVAELEDGALAGMHGEVRYHPEFDRF